MVWEEFKVFNKSTDKRILTLSHTEIHFVRIHQDLFHKLLPMSAYNPLLVGFIIICLRKTIRDDEDQVNNLVQICWVCWKRFKLAFFKIDFSSSLVSGHLYTQYTH